jgi:hypothetical protein
VKASSLENDSDGEFPAQGVFQPTAWSANPDALTDGTPNYEASSSTPRITGTDRVAAFIRGSSVCEVLDDLFQPRTCSVGGVPHGAAYWLHPGEEDLIGNQLTNRVIVVPTVWRRLHRGFSRVPRGIFGNPRSRLSRLKEIQPPLL